MNLAKNIQTEQNRQNHWIFQTNPKRFKIFDWLEYMKITDQWRISKNHRDEVMTIGVDPIWVATVDDDDIWAIRMQHHDKIVSENPQAALVPEKYDVWSIFQHINQIKKGDMAAIWIAGTNEVAGIYGMAQIITNTYEHPLPRAGNISYWIKEKDSEELPKIPWTIVSLRYEKLSVNFDNPLVSRASIKEDEDLKDMTILKFSQATNFGPIPMKQWQRIDELTRLASA